MPADLDGLMRLVSVVIPCYNNERHLGAAIDSVLAQSHRPLEILVVDDGSTDNSAEIARQYGDPVRLLSQSNQGCPAARNTGVNASQGHYLAFLDADDLWMEQKLRLQLKVLEDSPEIDCVYSHIEQFHSPELSAAEQARIFCPEGAQPARHASAMLVRRDAFLRIGLFDESLIVAEFLDWTMRAEQEHIGVVVLDDVLVRRRLHMTNNSTAQRHARPDFARVLKAALDRRREVSDSSSDEN